MINFTHINKYFHFKRILNACIIVIFAFWHIKAEAQPGFSEIYDFGSLSADFSNIILVNDTIVVSGTIFPEDINRWCVMFAMLDTSGTVLSVHYFPDTLNNNNTFYREPGWSLIRTSDGGYLTTGVMFNAGAAVKMNKDGSLGFYSTFPVLYYFAIEKAVEVPDGYLLAGTYQQEDLSVDVILLKMDKQGKELWRKYYNDSERMMSFNHLYYNNDNKIILTAGSEAGTTNLSSTIYSCYWVLDSLGNVTKTWRNNIPNVENGMRNLQILPNGNWIYSSGAFVAFSDSDWTLLRKLVCRDSNMNLLWQRFIPSYLSIYQNIYNIQPSEDGNWLAVGGIVPVDQPYNINGFIRKFSSGGDSIWQRIDLAIPNPVFESENRMGGIITLPGGNLVAAGFTTFYSDTLIKSWGWLMKISNNGCLFETDCMPASGTSLTGGEPLDLLVSPNPANDLVSFEMPGQSGHLRVFDLQGRIIFDTPFEGQASWNSRNAAAGVYGYLLQLEDGRTVSGKILVEH